jgi:hypothetical protein
LPNRGVRNPPTNSHILGSCRIAAAVKRECHEIPFASMRPVLALNIFCNFQYSSCC